MSRNSLGRMSKKPGLLSVSIDGVKVCGCVGTFDMFGQIVAMEVLVKGCVVSGCNPS